MTKYMSEAKEIFCQAVANDSSLVDAYLEAYPNKSEWKRSTLHNAGYKLSKRQDVAERIDEIKKNFQDKAKKKFSWDHDKSIKVLASIAVNTEYKESARVNAVKVLNELLGLNAPKRMDHSSSDGSMSPSNIEIGDAVLEAIKKKHECQ